MVVQSREREGRGRKGDSTERVKCERLRVSDRATRDQTSGRPRQVPHILNLLLLLSGYHRTSHAHAHPIPHLRIKLPHRPRLTAPFSAFTATPLPL